VGQSINTSQSSLSNRLADLTTVLGSFNPANGTWAVDFRAGANGSWTLAIDAGGTGANATTITSQDPGNLPGFSDVTGQSGLLFSLEPSASNNIGQIGQTPVTVAYRSTQPSSQIAIKPTTSAVPLLGSQVLTARVTSGGNAVTPTPTITWSTTLGSIVSTGATTARFTAPGVSGNATITASITGTTTTATVSVVNHAPPSIVQEATATPATVSGTTTKLDVLGTDASGESGLTYTWSAEGPASVSFLPNGTNLAQHATARFRQAGTYLIQVTATNPFGLSAVSTVTVNVVSNLWFVGITKP
jgi:hypothetical protein